MRGTIYVAIAILVAASSRSSAESDQVEPQQAPNSDFVTSDDTIYEVLPTRILRESRGSNDKLAVGAGDEERMMNNLSNGNSLSESLEQTTIKLTTDDVIAKAEEAIKNFKQLEPVLNMIRRKRQRIDPTPSNLGGQALHAPPNPDKSLVSVTENAPNVIANRLEKSGPTVIMKNAVRSITQHDYRPAPSGSSTTSAAATDIRLHEQPIARKGSELFKNIYPNKMVSNSVEHPLHMLEGNENSAHTVTVNGITYLMAQGPALGRKDTVNEEAKKIHEAFLKAFSLPFHQYPEETTHMLRLLRWSYNSSPNNINTATSLKDLANSQDPDVIMNLLDMDLKKLLGDGRSAVKATEKNLKEAYSVKLLIMYELFYDFCHGNRKLVGNLPSKSDRVDSILKVTT
uniref:Secreted RxLR effector protein 36 n=1 Tax=Plasmopara viticola TaxID=143451 RepID=RLR36_PLAVT|nr:RecName: Full=Secreted RxLR effector protein 36; Flags: Precursor [Plasmopara viticola]